MNHFLSTHPAELTGAHFTPEMLHLYSPCNSLQSMSMFCNFSWHLGLGMAAFKVEQINTLNNKLL